MRAEPCRRPLPGAPGASRGRGHRLVRAGSVCLIAACLLAACGGGGGGTAGDTGTPLPPLGPGETAYDDPATYSTSATAALPGAVEAAAVTLHSLTLNGTPIAYTATAGHLIARDPASGAAEASMFYVAYTANGADPATRPVSFFYNGGPGSASVWLHLGSFAPVRLVTGVPATTEPTPFPLVANTESLIDTSDLVFIDAVGTGLSEAITPYVNQSFWGVDSDAAVFRDFILRWLAVNGRAASPKFLYGESYGGPRTAILAGLLQTAGVLLDGLVLQSPALDYNSNCGVSGSGNCGANLPTYAAIGDAQGLLSPTPPDLDTYMGQMRLLADSRYLPAVAALFEGTPFPPDLPPILAADTGIGAGLWQTSFNFFPDSFQVDLLPGQITGRYDGRMVAAIGSPLAADGDPSSTFITPSFATVIASYLRDTLRYTSGSTYVLTSNAIAGWDFSHDGQSLPDTVPDLAAALAQNPGLRVIMVGGYDDLATPFHVTELDLARLGSGAPVQTRVYPGGHMSYLFDPTRVRQKADVAAFMDAAPAAGAMRAASARRALALAEAAGPAAALARAGSPATVRQPSVPEPPIQRPLHDPWVPH